jgi:hypothetical protein
LVALSFAVDGYTSYLSPPSAYLDKHRVIILVRSTLATAANARICKDIALSTIQSAWVELDLHDGPNKKKTFILGGVYREWGGTAKEKEEAVATLEAQMLIASSITRHVIVLGDFNLDRHISKDTRYNHRPLLAALDSAVATAGLRYFAPVPTYQSHGSYQRRGEAPDRARVWASDILH